MDRSQWLERYEAAPSAVRFYLLNPVAKENESLARNKLAYDHDAWERIMDVAWDAIFDHLGQRDFSDRIQRIAGDRKPEDVEREVLLHIILPLADLIAWDVETRLQELGASTAEIQNVGRVSLRPVSYGAAVKRIAQQARISLLSEEGARRLREVFVSFVKGVRTVEQLTEVLERTRAEGGLGFSHAQAGEYVSAMQDFMSRVQVLSEDEYADWYTRFLRAQADQATQTKTEGKESSAPKNDDDAQITALKATHPKPVPEMDTALDKAVQAAMDRINISSLDVFLQNRLRSTVSTRLRDVRNTFQIQSILTRPIPVGGLALDASEAERVGHVIEQVFAEFHEAVLHEEKSSIEKTLDEQKKKIGERRQRESEEHARWYEDKQRALGVFGRGATTPIRQSAPTPQTLTQTGVPLLVGTLGAAQKNAYQRMEFSGSSLPAPTTRRLDDVQAPVRLVGLDEELGSLTLAEFRRMAREPSAAAEKIFQKLDTLARESFQRWTEGVKSFRQSPLQQMYLRLVMESFAVGKTVAEILEDRRKKDPHLPTAEEIGAIIDLNSRIHL